ncbi:MAG: hypothetical protein R2729_01755 [Bryobacteraceae bacterium]
MHSHWRAIVTRGIVRVLCVWVATAQVPERYPQGRQYPGGLPPPGIPWPKRGKKDDNKDAAKKVRLASVEGTLRELAAKHMLLEVKSGDLLRFRLTAKTQFTGKDGKPIRDSLLNPGDAMAVLADPGDEETAVTVIFLRAGRDEDRARASAAVDAAKVRAPESRDFGKVRTVKVAEADAETDEPKVEESAAGLSPEESRRMTDADSELVTRIKEAAASFAISLPEFAASQTTKRYAKDGSQWRLVETITAGVSYASGAEEYRDLRVNGQPSNRRPEEAGAWSAADFGAALEQVLSVAAGASFERQTDTRRDGRQQAVLSYAVSEGRSQWTVVAPDGKKFRPAYSGTIEAEADTGRTVLIEQRAGTLPDGFGLKSVEVTLEFAPATVKGKEYWLPAGGETISCARDGACTREETVLTDYR